MRVIFLKYMTHVFDCFCAITLQDKVEERETRYE